MTDEGRERAERRRASEIADITDDKIALEICRAIRDNEDARDYDRLKAITIINRIKKSS